MSHRVRDPRRGITRKANARLGRLVCAGLWTTHRSPSA